jgi:hypothetical protein
MAKKVATKKATAKKPAKKAAKKAKSNREKAPLDIWREKVKAGTATLTELCQVYQYDDEQNFAVDYLNVFGYDAAEQMAGAVEDTMKKGDTPPKTIAELKEFFGDNF